MGASNSEAEIETFYAKNISAWRQWLQQNSPRATEVWLVFYKKHSDKPTISYEEAVEEALCFGWIDGMVKRLDDARYAQRFTPRKAKSQWSPSNIKRVRKLIAQGRMTVAGLNVFNPERRRQAAALPTALPQALEAQFHAQLQAWKNFQAFPPYYRRMTTQWIASAKKEETQRKRLRQLMDSSARNERIKFI